MALLNPGEAIMVSPDPAVLVDELDLGTIAANVLAYGRGAILHGWSAMETTGSAAAKFRIRDGHDASGSVLARVALAAGASSMALADDLGIRGTSGLFVEVVSGSVELTLYVRVPGTDL